MKVMTVEKTCQPSSSRPSAAYLVKTGMNVTLSDAPATGKGESGVIGVCHGVGTDLMRHDPFAYKSEDATE